MNTEKIQFQFESLVKILMSRFSTEQLALLTHWKLDVESYSCAWQYFSEAPSHASRGQLLPLEKKLIDSEVKVKTLLSECFLQIPTSESAKKNWDAGELYRKLPEYESALTGLAQWVHQFYAALQINYGQLRNRPMPLTSEHGLKEQGPEEQILEETSCSEGVDKHPLAPIGAQHSASPPLKLSPAETTAQERTVSAKISATESFERDGDAEQENLLEDMEFAPLLLQGEGT